MSNLITASEAFLQLNEPNTVIADVRFVLGEPAAGYNAYLLSHIPGAVFFDLNTDLSGPKMIHGGGHPLPHPDLFADKLGLAGIDEHTNVIVYDDQGGSIASRLWWMLKYSGHERVKLLSGGFTEWVAAGYPVEAKLPQPTAKRFVNRFNESLLAEMSEVKDGIGQAGRVLIDSRVPERYTGKDTSKYAKAGHIPGAINHYWEEGSPSGVFLDASHQRERFRDIPTDREIIVYCGAGVTACPNILALTEAGYKNVKLYVGSWSDWVSYEENPIATEEEEKRDDLFSP